MKVRFSSAIVITILISILAIAVPALAGQTVQWPTYHMNEMRTGYNSDVGLNGGSINLIWTWPRYDSTDSSFVVDIARDKGFWALLPTIKQWTSSSTLAPGQVTDYYPMNSDLHTGYYYTKAITGVRPTQSALWFFGDGGNGGAASHLMPGKYLVQVWFPSSPLSNIITHTTSARYVVSAKNGVRHTFKVDQTRGGQWVSLGSQPFDLDETSYVELGNATDDGSKDVVVVADAVRFVAPLGTEIYTSPTTAKISDDITAANDMPAVFIGVVESPITSRTPGIPDFGAQYGVRSYFQSSAPVGTNPTTDAERNVGTAQWRYPRTGGYDPRTPVDTYTLDRQPEEGPVGRISSTGGIMSSSTVAIAGGRQRVIFGGMDGQVHCVDAQNGNMIWRGPGVTISEPQGGVAGGLPSGWNQTRGRLDAFGGIYAISTVVKDESDATKILYDIEATTSDPGVDAKLRSKGHYYAIYAWIPPRTNTLEPPRSRDATYIITYWDAVSGKTVTDHAKVDLRDDRDPDITDPERKQNMLSDLNSGKWVRVGGTYWNPSKVELTTLSDALSTSPRPGDEKRIVVADAIMVVPAEIGAFTYSSAVADDSTVYIGNANGRVYALATAAPYPGSKATQLKWTFPPVQSVNPATNPGSATASAIGAVVASPALAGSTLIVPSMDGRVYGLNKTTGALRWTYDPSKLANAETGLLPEQFSSSPAVDGNNIYVPSTGGRMHCINLADGASNWISPNLSSTPLSPFRFSTPSVATSVGPSGVATYIYCGTAGGKVHCFDSTGNIIESGTFNTINMYSPIQGSVALDRNNIYIPVMGTGEAATDGGIWWTSHDGLASPDNGTSYWVYSGYSNLGQVFSSPAVANDYVYVGSSKGRLYAFSSLAFGGVWTGSDTIGQPPDEVIRAERPDPATSSQVNLFSEDVFYYTLERLKELALTPGALTADTLGHLLTGTNSFVDSTFDSTSDTGRNGHKRALPYGSGTVSVGTERRLFFEWGEFAYLIAWNLPDFKNIEGGSSASTPDMSTAGKVNSVKFRFNNAGAGAAAGGSADPQSAQYLFRYKAGTDTDGNDIYKSIAMTAYDFTGTRATPPSPGSGWTISVHVSGSTGSGTNTLSTSQIGVVPELTGTPGNFTVKDVKSWREQNIGINNPLAIRDNGLRPRKDATPSQQMPIALGWPKYHWEDGTYKSNRYGNAPSGSTSTPVEDPTIHCNGNQYTEPGLNNWIYPVPQLYLGWGAHGTNSQISTLGVMDRSATGLRASETESSYLSTFRIQTGDLHWQGGTGATQGLMPWDYPPNVLIGLYDSRLQRDYPDIANSNARYQKTSDNSDPSLGSTILQPAMPFHAGGGGYDKARLRSDSIESWVEIPKYQPANTQGPGYSTRVVAYLDVNRNGRFDGGNFIEGRPTTYVEPYREFQVSVDVPPDYHMVVEQPLTIDITGPDRSLAPHGLGLYCDPATLTDWWKTFTVKNLGNVNISNVKIAKSLSNGPTVWPLGLTAEGVNPFFPILGTLSVGTGVSSGIISSLDGWDPNWGSINMEPFVTTDAGPYTTARDLGFTISKPRVGDVNPMELTIPDKRKVEVWGGPGTFITNAILAKTGDMMNMDPLKPSLSVIVPLTQPSGSYHQLVPVYSDTNPSFAGMTVHRDVLDIGAEPYTDPTFRVNVVVAENRITGGTTPGVATQIDPNPAAGDTVETYGDAQPAAWRDPITGNVYLFWSSNRFLVTGSGPNQPNLPWYIARAGLEYQIPTNGTPGAYNWKPDNPSAPNSRWWVTPSSSSTPFLPGFEWPDTPIAPLPNSIKHSSPFAAVNMDSDLSKEWRTWLFWQGQADMVDSNDKIVRDNRIFYTNATNGEVTGTSTSVFNIARDTTLAKMNPKAVPYFNGDDEVIWLTWQGGDSGRWSLYGNLNVSPRDRHNQSNWSPDVRFLTPTSLVSVADPSPLMRRIGTSALDPGFDRYLDITYTGATKHGQTSNVILTRYKWSPSSGDPWKNPKVDPVPLPRMMHEELSRDSKLNVYTSANLAWLRPRVGGNLDLWGEVFDADGKAVTVPFIHVLLPDGREISATDGSIIHLDNDGNLVVDESGSAIDPEIDRATGVYTYRYTTDAKEILGEMLVDFSAGIVRFTNPLPTKTRVYADYTPQAIRLTHGTEPDSAPFTFIERTPMSKQKDGQPLNPGLILPSSSYVGPTPTDRMWLFWTKPSTSGVQASTIYYKTYRIAVALPEPIDMKANGEPSEEVIVDGVLGACEVSYDGKNIFFAAADERYPGLNPYPGPVSVTYRPRGAKSGTRVTHNLHTLTWQEERSETALPTRLRVNEGQVSAFADPCVTPTKIWVFWSSSRAGESDIYYQTISPNFRAILY